jgi:UDP-N-acetylmuramoyl-tripeptide--D-alanyl-D-alanine ligase
MITMKASLIAEVVGGALHGSDCDVTAPATLSSRDATAGSIFLAIKGERVDGHDFVEDAFAHGAVLALTTHAVGQRCVVVDDVTKAVGALAAYVREQLSDLVVVGITGSQGKTTTKELLAAILATRGETVAPAGNNNNELGVPLTLLRCTPDTKFCVAEMGARHKGDISLLCSIARPQVGVVLRVAAAHIGEFGSLENIASAKSEMISSLKSDAVAVLGNYDPFTPAMKSLHDGRTLVFGEHSHDDIRATDIELRDGRPHFDLVTPEGRSTVALRLYGEHQIANALAAATVAHALGFTTDEIATALSIAESHARWRMEIHELVDLTLINDAYNASPDSMAAALRTLAHLSQERGGESWAFIGKMGELGESSIASHQAIGTLASELGIDHLISIGEKEYGAALTSQDSTTFHFCSTKEEALVVAGHINRGDVVLCKASRSERLEELAESIESAWKIKIKAEESGEQ